MGFFSSLPCSFLSKIGFMPLIPIPPNAFRILLGFCFAVLFWTLVSTIYLFHGFFHVCFKHPCFSYFEKTNQTTNSKPFTQSCVHSVSPRVSFLPFTVKFLKKKKKNHLYSLSFKGLHFVWNWKVTDDILVDKHSGLSPRQLPSLSHIIKLFSQQPESLLSFIGSYSVCPLQAFLPVRHLPFAFSLLAKVLSVHETVSSHDLAFEIDQNCILRHDDNWVLERPLKVEVRWSEKPENLQAVGPPSFSLLCSDLLY